MSNINNLVEEGLLNTISLLGKAINFGRNINTATSPENKHYVSDISNAIGKTAKVAPSIYSDLKSKNYSNIGKTSALLIHNLHQNSNSPLFKRQIESVADKINNGARINALINPNAKLSRRQFLGINT